MPRFSAGRRRFTIGAAATAAAALISPAEALQQAGAAKAADTPEQKIQAAMAKLSPSAQAEVEAKVASIFRKYGSRLSEEQKLDIRRVMAETQEGLEKMRAFPLDNGDQPATVFHLGIEGEKK